MKVTSQLVAWSTLFRATNSITGIIGVFLGSILALGKIPEEEYAVITFFQAISVWSFMCSWNALNDYLDLEIDRLNKPNRPIPSGTISKDSAKKGIFLMMIISIISISLAGITASNSELGFSAWLPSLVIWILALLLLINYESGLSFSMNLKNKGLPGNIVISLSIGIVFPFGAAGVFQPFSEAAWSAFFIGFFYNLSREIIKDIEDMDGDLGRNTYAMNVGPERARILAWIVSLLTIVAILIPFGIEVFPTFHVIGIIPSFIMLLMVKTKLHLGEDYEAQQLLKKSMQFCLIALLLSSIIGF